ncbi:hypothetical protein PCANC_12899 [Puccinia coronata f. sp. avenae]|uniref:Secreted protein n=1 Tax=Puccinia coronata f. sp. avenae TaxID=200324 RepID=A0A2N5VE68_9BASI|nr:hypothetical protein PCANC_12899 [Puccinia coronata f. sp. avenae]
MCAHPSCLSVFVPSLASGSLASVTSSSLRSHMTLCWFKPKGSLVSVTLSALRSHLTLCWFKPKGYEPSGALIAQTRINQTRSLIMTKPTTHPNIPTLTNLN